MKGKYFDMYVSQKGNDVFKYEVTGTPEEIAAFKAAYPVDYVREETGNPIFFSSVNEGKTVELAITQKTNKVFIKSNAAKRGVLSAIKQASRGGNDLFAQAMANKLAEATFAEMYSGSSNSVATKPAVKPVDNTAAADAQAEAEAEAERLEAEAAELEAAAKAAQDAELIK